jgi:hypothetical protein
MASLSCNDAAVPDIKSLPIPQNINVVVAPGSNASFPPMVSCCQPNPVHVVDNCTLWCEIPKSYFDNKASQDDVGSKLSSCLRGNAANSTWPKITGLQFNAGARPGGSWTVKEAGILVLAVSGLVYLM